MLPSVGTQAALWYRNANDLLGGEHMRAVRQIPARIAAQTSRGIVGQITKRARALGSPSS